VADHFKISVDQPCSQKFNSFTPTKAGGFCQACQKEVVDFSNMSDVEIRNYFMNINKQKSTCGHFRTDQLKEYTIPHSPKTGPSSFTTGAGLAGISLLSMLPVADSAAQPAAQPQEVSVHLEDEETPRSPSTITPGDSLLSGIVTDAETGEPIPFANIILKDHTAGVSTDMDGKFRFPVRLNKGDILQVSFLAYERVEYTVTDELQVNIRMTSQTLTGLVVITGEVAVIEPYASKRSLWDRLKAFFR
tara:strand:- start:1382 stop:2122 length:741 start_codon:yes stop_codon:yes gene_type:complete